MSNSFAAHGTEVEGVVDRGITIPDYVARIQTAERRVAEAEGAAARMREALESALSTASSWVPFNVHSRPLIDKALSSSAGREMLKRVRRMEALLRKAYDQIPDCERCSTTACNRQPPLCHDMQLRADIDAYLAKGAAAPPAGVTWTHTDRDANTWQCSGCDALWTFTCDGPTENKMRFCPECGKAITKVVEAGDAYPYDAEDDSEDDDDPGSDNPEAPGCVENEEPKEGEQ